MKNKQAKELLAKYRTGILTNEEKGVLETWYVELSLSEEVTIDPADMERRLEAVWKRLPANTSLYSKTIRLPIWRIAVAAILLIGIGTGWYMWYMNGVSHLVEYTNDITPGTNKAILTLANGRQIQLSSTKKGTIAQLPNAIVKLAGDGHVVYTSNTDVNSLKPEYNTVTVPKGGQYHLTLADGTNVWLNSASSITYPILFRGTTREITMSGEAYFEVAKNKHLPFRVKSGLQLVEVLGTHFNINSYADEDGIKTTLLEGSVQVSMPSASALTSKNGMKIIPGQQSLFRATKQSFMVQSADTTGAVAWKKGFFYFKNADIESVMQQFSRWYDVKVEYRGKIPAREISGKINRNMNVSKALAVLNYLKIHFVIENSPEMKKIIVIP